MGKPLMLQEADAERIDALTKRLGARTKIDVVRSALDLLERCAEKRDRVARWKRAAKMVAAGSRKMSLELQRYGRLGRLD
jgi:hypothetical protein